MFLLDSGSLSPWIRRRVFVCLGVNESVGCGVRVHLDIYVFNSDNITPSPPQHHSPCGVQPRHMLTRML